MKKKSNKLPKQIIIATLIALKTVSLIPKTMQWLYSTLTKKFE